jgi:aminopeptidase YwaD
VANLTAVKAGRSKEEVVLAAHLDTVPESPGANDDASGVAALLELAALLKEQEPPRSVRFLFLTAEEEIEGFEGHGYSSLQFFAGLAPDQVQNLAVACWMDKIAAGPTFKVLHTHEASASLARRLQERAESRGMKPQLIAAKRWSKKMAFEDHGIPTAWIEYGPAPHLHQPGDDLTNVDPGKLKAVGDLVYRWLMEGGEKP